MMTTLLCLLVLALVVTAVLLVVAGVLATVFSPLIVLALCIWLLVKLVRGSPRSRAPAGATMTG
jgi:hypothetical protein